MLTNRETPHHEVWYVEDISSARVFRVDMGPERFQLVLKAILGATSKEFEESLAMVVNKNQNQMCGRIMPHGRISGSGLPSSDFDANIGIRIVITGIIATLKIVRIRSIISREQFCGCSPLQPSAASSAR